MTWDVNECRKVRVAAAKESEALAVATSIATQTYSRRSPAPVQSGAIEGPDAQGRWLVPFTMGHRYNGHGLGGVCELLAQNLEALAVHAARLNLGPIDAAAARTAAAAEATEPAARAYLEAQITTARQTLGT